MSLNKKDQRIRRSRQTRKRIAVQRVARLAVHRTNLHIYASVIPTTAPRCWPAHRRSEAEVRKEIGAAGKGGNAAAAAIIGKRIADKAKAAGHREGRVRPRRFRLSRPHQGAGRCRS
jgi:large subunit ribosomal protein L18